MRGTPKTPDLLPLTPDNYPDRVPDFTSETEEQEFWATHSSTPYHSHGELVFGGRATIEGRSPEIRARLVVPVSDEVVSWLEQRSRQLGVRLEEMVSEWVEDRAHTERRIFGEDTDGRESA